jgi:hypothetical protein
MSPPLAVINGGLKLVDLNLDPISSTYHRQGSSETQIETRDRLILLRDIWCLFMDARDLAQKWENENRGKKRKRDQDDDDMRTLPQKKNRITRSAAKFQRNS